MGMGMRGVGEEWKGQGYGERCCGEEMKHEKSNGGGELGENTTESIELFAHRSRRQRRRGKKMIQISRAYLTKLLKNIIHE